MSTYKKRIVAMQALAAGTIISKNSAFISVIKKEFDEILKIERVKPLQRRRLLQVIHSTRALDSFLKNFTDNYGIRGKNHSLGGYLVCLESHTNSHLSKLSTGRAKYYQQKIVNLRNLYMHEAGKFPINESEISSLLSEMQSCLAEVARL